MGEKKASIIPIVKKICKWILITLSVVVGLFLAVLAGTTAYISSKNGKNTIISIVEENIKATVEAEVIDLSFFSSFPNIEITLTDVNLYSTVRNQKDSLVSFSKLHATVDVMKFLFLRQVYVSEIELEKPTIVLMVDKNGVANWSLMESTKDTDTTVTEIPKIILEKLAITEAKINFSDSTKNRFLAVDSLSVTAKASYLEELKISDLKIATVGISYADSMVQVAPMHVSMLLSATANKDFNRYDIEKLGLKVQEIAFETHGKIAIENDSIIRSDLSLHLSAEDLGKVLKMVPEPYASKLKALRLGGSLIVDGTICGTYDGDKQIPVTRADVTLNEAWMRFVKGKEVLHVDFHTKACLNTVHQDSTYVQIEKLKLSNGISYFDFSGNAEGLNNPLIKAQLKTNVNLDTLAATIPVYNDLRYGGKLSADIITEFFLNDIKKNNWKAVKADGTVFIGRIHAQMPSNNVYVFSKNAKLKVDLNTEKSRRDNQLRFFVARLGLDTLLMRLGKNNIISLSRFSTFTMADKVSSEIPLLMASVQFNGLRSVMSDTAALVSKATSMSISVKENSKDKFLPLLTARVRTDSMMFFRRDGGVLVDSVRMTFNTTPRFRRFYIKNGTRKEIDPSERKAVSLDSIIRLVSKISNDTTMPMADAMLKNFNFYGNVYSKVAKYSSPYFPINTSARKLDIAFTDDTVTLKKFRLYAGSSNASFSGELQNVRRALLRGQTLSGKLDIKSRRINFNEIFNALYKGDQTYKQQLKLKKARENGLLKLRNTERAIRRKFSLIRPEIFKYNYFKEREERISNSNFKVRLDSIAGLIGDDEILKQEEFVETDTTASFGLMCLPNNLDLSLNTNIDTIRFLQLEATNFKGGVMLKNSTIQLNDLDLKSNVGDLNLNAMYRCKSSDVATAGFAVKGENIVIENLITALPVLDTIVPMLRSFKGSVSSEISCIADLNSNLNLDLKTINAACLIQGKNLVLLDGETFSEIAKMLMFKKKTQNLIDNISVELLVKDNNMQVLPFMLEMDKYKVAVGGQNSLDMKFNYHISVLESPLPFKLGIDVKGNLDKFDFDLVKPKYSDKSSIAKTGQFANEGINLRKELHESLQKAVRSAAEVYAKEEKKSYGNKRQNRKMKTIKNQ